MPQDGARRRLAVTERDRGEDGIAWPSGRRRRRGDVHRPLQIRGRRRIAEVRVAGLIAQVGGKHQIAGWNGRGERHLDADRELALEDGERLILAGLFEIG